ncbi:hypothetical protein JCM19237_1191 [Photobacterium aphoticum]|uniref:Uncharacterized protein n=1 Tax=Photobacterium aphoticum TaxID=754436 RepID=A0A090QRU6_9GAMM|nr:hypothetical protein JCM19237_1191 [Photobacterium aphoticum]
MQTIDNAFAQAKFDRTLLVSPVGLCYVITPVGRPLDNDPSLALNQFRHTYRAKHLLASHSNRWGYRFDLTRLYHQLCPTPLQHHKTRDDMLTELSQRIAHGELLVYKVHNFIEM